MRLVAIVFALLAAAAGQQPPQPPPGQIWPMRTDCRAAYDYLLDQNSNHFRNLDGGLLLEYETSMGWCWAADRGIKQPRNNLGMRRLLSETLSARMLQFAHDPNMWQQFLAWDSDPAHR